MAAFAVLIVLIIMLAALASNRYPPEAVCAFALVALVLVPLHDDTGWRVGVITVQDAIKGFSNNGMLTVAVLFLVVAGLRETSAVEWVASWFLGRPKSHREALTRLVVPIAALSTFLNNTPLVAMFIPVVTDWAKKNRLRPSQLLIPLSYATILGGMCSMIGTSTNLVVGGLVEAHTQLGPLNMFDPAWLGIPAVLVGAGYLILFGPRLLPARATSLESLSNPREYTVEMLVQAGSPLVGKTIEEAGLRHLEATYLAEIERQGRNLMAVSPDERLQADDRLIFVGVVESVKDLQNIRGLVPATNQIFKLDAPRYRRRLFEAVVSDTCPIVGQTIRESQFRNRYRAAVLAVARQGERIRSKLGDITLRPGDTLLIEADPNFGGNYRYSRDFFLVSMLDDSTPRRHERAPYALTILLGMIVCASFGWLDLLQAGALAACLMLLFRCCTVAQARQSVNGPVLVIIACALGIERALDKSGAAAMAANGMINIAGDNPWLVLAAIYLVTTITTELITNNAAVALTFPIAVSAAGKMDVNLMPFVMCVMMAGSAAFSTPIGYQTNLMVYGPGGYRFSDYFKVGIPLNITVGITTVVLAPLVWPF
jgi:di/tricarboxylate transporter